MAKAIVKISDNVSRHNRAIAARARHPRVGALFLREIDIEVDKNFAAEGRDEQGNTGTWPKRKQVKRVIRKKRKVRSKKGGKLLYQDGHLRRSTKAIRSAEYKGGVWIMEKGSNLKYAGVHNFGTVGAGGSLPDIPHPGTTNGFGRGIYIPPHLIPMPQREFLMVPNKALDAMAAKAAKFIMGC